MTITVNLPDGSKANFPDGTPVAAMRAAIQKKFPPTQAGPRQPQSTMSGIPTNAGNTPVSAAVTDMQQGASPPAASGAPPPVSPSPAAAQSPPDAGGDNWLANAANIASSAARGDFSPLLQPQNVGNTSAFLSSLGNTASFGLAPAAMRTGMNAMSPGSGDAMQQNVDATNAANPAGAAAGAVAAIPVDMALTAPIGGLGAEGTAAGALLRGGGAAGNVARATATGGTAAAVQAATAGESPGDIAANAAVGAVAGPLIGKAAGVAAGAVRGLRSPAARAWAYIAKRIGVSGDDLQSFVDAHTAQTGTSPSVQQVLDAHAAGAVKDFASNNPQSAMLLQQAQRTAQEGLPAQATAVVENAGIPRPTPTFLAGVHPNQQSPMGLANHLDTTMDAAMQPMRDASVSLPEELRGDPDLNTAIAGRKFRDIRERLDNDELTLGDVDIIRQQLNAAAANHPAGSHSPFGQLANEVRDEAASQIPAYQGALDEYGNGARYIQGFNHSYSTGATAETATDASTRRALGTPEGMQGHAAGVATNMRNQAADGPQQALTTLQQIATPGAPQTALRSATGAMTNAPEQAAAAHVQAMRAVNASTPASVAPAREGNASLTTGLAETAAGAHFAGFSQVARAATHFLRRNAFPPAVQREIATGLTSTDPAVRAVTLARLKRENAGAKGIKELQLVMSGVGGAAVASGMASTRDQ